MDVANFTILGKETSNNVRIKNATLEKDSPHFVFAIEIYLMTLSNNSQLTTIT